MTTDAAIDISRARADLASTLNAIEEKLNVPKRTKRAVQENPLLVAAVGVGVAVAIGAVVWFSVAAVRKR